MSAARIGIGIKIGSSLYENIAEVPVGFDGFETNENIAQGLEAVARAIRAQIGAFRTEGIPTQ